MNSIGEIAPELSRHLCRDGLTIEKTLGTLESIEQMARYAGTRLSKSAHTVVACALTASLTLDNIRLDETECAMLYATYKQYLTETNDFPPEISRLSSPTTLEARRQFDHAMLNAYSNRLLFSTPSGYFGLGPQTVKPGDALVILYGGRFPFIFRPFDLSKSEYEFVGYCYVHSIMDGEAVRAYNAEGKEDTVFYLR